MMTLRHEKKLKQIEGNIIEDVRNLFRLRKK